MITNLRPTVSLHKETLPQEEMHLQKESQTLPAKATNMLHIQDGMKSFQFIFIPYVIIHT
jgi:hypothetical protein